MSFGRQKRLLLGWLALLAPLPLPFNGVVSWLPVALYVIGVVLYLRRANLDPPRWLPLWGMNVLGLVYLPLFLFDLLVLSSGRLVAAVLHLCLFAVLVKLFSLTRERDKWQASMGIFFLFLAAMGTSVHPTIVLYLVAFLVLVLLLFTRFAFLHVLSSFGRDDPALARIPLRGFLALATASSVLLAVPLFLFLPRVRSPFILGGGKTTGTVIEAVGFSDEVTLDSIGLIRESREVAMRMIEEGAADPGREMRFKAATYDVYQGKSWRRTPERTRLRRGQGVRFQIASQAPVGWARIWLQPLRSDSLPLPVETVLVEPRATALAIDEGGAVSLGFSPLQVTQYRVGLASRAVLTGSVPSGPSDGSLDPSGVTPRIAGLAGRVMGQGSAAERVRRLEKHLMGSYGYTLDFQGRATGDNPIEDFLFRYKSGQCEYFSSSMVLMLRSQGIHARLVTGFLGGEYNPFEGYYVVRDSNAHAWVEAYLPGEGWRIFDPTPPAGRPAGTETGITGLMRQAWDFMVFRWDRYVLTFGLYDQLRIFGGLRELWHDFWGIFGRDKAEEPSSPSATLDEILQEDGEPSQAPGLPKVPLTGALALTAMAVITWILYLRFRPPLTATAAYRQLRQRLGRSGARLPESAPPLTVRVETEARYPAAAAPAARVIDFYLRESFGGQELEDGEREELKAALQEAEKKMRKAG
jgi:transglutaminase-like putative cysteine protease